MTSKIQAPKPPEHKGSLLDRLAGAFHRSKPEEAAARRLYTALVLHARQKLFFQELGVPDNPEGRFEVIALHAALVIRHLSRGQDADRRCAQALFDLMFADMDQNLRELGVGDLSVGKQIKRLATQFYARLQVLDDTIDGEDHEALRAMLKTNIYGSMADPDTLQIEGFLACLITADRLIGAQEAALRREGRLDWPDTPVLLAAIEQNRQGKAAELSGGSSLGPGPKS